MALPHFGSLKETDSSTFINDLDKWCKDFWQLTAKVKRIQSRLQPRLLHGNMLRDAERIKKGSHKNHIFLIKNTHCLKKDLKSGYIRVSTNYYRPIKLMETKLYNSFDTLENRILRWVLIRMRETLSSYKSGIIQKGQVEDRMMAGYFERMEREITRLLQVDAMMDIGVMRHVTGYQVLQMSPSYQDVYRCYLHMVK